MPVNCYISSNLSSFYIFIYLPVEKYLHDIWSQFFKHLIYITGFFYRQELNFLSQKVKLYCES